MRESDEMNLKDMRGKKIIILNSFEKKMKEKEAKNGEFDSYFKIPFQLFSFEILKYWSSEVCIFNFYPTPLI